MARTTKSPAARSARSERSRKAIPRGTAVNASPKLWMRSASRATEPESTKTSICAAAVRPSTAKERRTARRPWRERLIESWIRPCECSGWGRTASRRSGARAAITLGLGELTCGRRACESRSEVLDVRDGLFEQLADVVVVEVVDDAATVAVPDDKSEVTEQPQLVRDCGRLHLHGLRELVHGARASLEPAEYADAAGRRERLHRLGDDASERGIQLVAATVRLSVGHHVSLAEQLLRPTAAPRRRRWARSVVAGSSGAYTGATSGSPLGSASPNPWRERIPSLANTFFRCHSTVRGLRNRRDYYPAKYG